MNKKLLSTFTSILVIGLLLSGCGSKDNAAKKTDTKNSSTTTVAKSDSTDDSMPIKVIERFMDLEASKTKANQKEIEKKQQETCIAQNSTITFSTVDSENSKKVSKVSVVISAYNSDVTTYHCTVSADFIENKTNKIISNSYVIDMKKDGNKWRISLIELAK